MYTTDIVTFCAAECERQESGEMSVARMFSAYTWALNTIREDGYDSLLKPHMMEAFIYKVGSIIEPDNKSGYRKVPAFFKGFKLALDHNLIPGALQSLYGSWDGPMTTRDFVYEFLKIHPFKDGNGRTAAILWNTLNRRLLNPETCPDFFSSISV